MAEGYFRHLISKSKRKDITVSSAGTFAGDGELPSQNSIEAMKTIGIDIAHYKSSPLTEEMLKVADIIVTMTLSHKHHIGQMSIKALKKTKILGEYNNSGNDLADPFGGGSDVYGYCLNTMKPSIENLFNDILLK